MTAPEKDKAYIDWKGWVSERPFGSLAAADERYFSKELTTIGASQLASVLEIGFGNGSFLEYARRRHIRAVGVEQNRHLVQQARALGFEAHVSGESLDGPDQGFDLVAAFDVMEHIPEEAQVSWLSGLREQLAPGGLILLRFPNGDSPFGLMSQNGDPTHITFVGSLKARFLAAQAGFTDIVVRAPQRPLVFNSPHQLGQQLFSKCAIAILELAVRGIYPRYRASAYFSDNLVMVARRPVTP